MKLSTMAGGALRQYAGAQANYNRSVRDEVVRLLKVQSVTQPNSRSTVAMHDFAYRLGADAERWELVGL